MDLITDVGLEGSLVDVCVAAEVLPPDAVAILAQVDPGRLDGAGRVALVQAWDRVAAMVAGFQQRAMAAVVESTEGEGLPAGDAAFEVGAALGLSAATAWDRVEVAADLTWRLPSTLAALTAGQVSWLQAQALARLTHPLSDGATAAVESRVLPSMPGRPLALTRRAVKQAVVAVDPDGARARATTSAAARRIDRSPQPDAMQGGWLTLPVGVAGDVWGRLTERARTEQRARRSAGADDPGLDALRVDALVDAVLHRGCGAASSLAAPVLPRCRCGGAQTAAVVLDLATALGLADRPGEVPGHGPVPAVVARQMAADRDWVRWLVDPGTGQLVDRGACTYRPSGALRAFVLARDRSCGFRGCTRPASMCDCDHTVAASVGGRTVEVNLGPLCRAHHNAKTHGRWRLAYDPGTGEKTWTSPLGRVWSAGTDPPLL